MERQVAEPDIVIYNASSRVPGPLSSVDPAAVEKSIAITTFGAFLASQQAAKRMEPRGRGAIFFTGASAGVKGFAQSAAFAMGKFGLRGLAQSAARELGPKGIHVAHFNIDGGVRSKHRPDPSGQPDRTLDPDAIAQTYIDVLANRETPGRTKSTFGRGQNDSRRCRSVRHLSRYNLRPWRLPPFSCRRTHQRLPFGK